MPDKIKLTEQVDVLFEGIEVTADQKEKFAIKLEAVLTEKTRSIKEELSTKKDEEVVTGITEATEAMEENINKYLEYVVTEWMEENKLAVEGGLKTEIVEGFIVGLKDLFESSYVDMPEGKEDILASTEAKVATLTNDLNEAIEAATTLKAQIEKFEKDAVVDEHAEDLTDTQSEKLYSLVEDVEYTDAEAYSAKVKTIRESFFKSVTGKTDEELAAEQKILESTADASTKRMNKYINAL